MRGSHKSARSCCFVILVTYIDVEKFSLFLGLSYVISSVSIFDEYTNVVLNMASGSCVPGITDVLVKCIRPWSSKAMLLRKQSTV
jgi:hypothetical protein